MGCSLRNASGRRIHVCTAFSVWSEPSGLEPSMPKDEAGWRAMQKNIALMVLQRSGTLKMQTCARVTQGWPVAGSTRRRVGFSSSGSAFFILAQARDRSRACCRTSSEAGIGYLEHRVDLLAKRCLSVVVVACYFIVTAGVMYHSILSQAMYMSKRTDRVVKL
jgi:hypothetical protein